MDLAGREITVLSTGLEAFATPVFSNGGAGVPGEALSDPRDHKLRLTQTI